ncbi:hypothetical protein EV183_001034 [Coemansia sp. RSA 2336]|nr:hypothetical protein EV183_001034 [Coemansia sp. RSA 2336]
MPDKQMLIAGARFASIVLSCISAIASLVVLVSYTRTVLRIRAHHRQIIEDSKPPAPAPQPRAHCFSCESIATPCMSQLFYPMPAHPSMPREPFMQPVYKPDQQPSQRVSDDASYEWSISSDKKKVRRRINLPCPVEYYNRMAANMSLERLALPSMHKRRERLSRKPSSKIALLSAMDLLLHLFWIINTLTTTCHVTLFFFTMSLLLYMFLLAFFALTSLLRLRNMQNSPASTYTRSRRADLAIYLGMAAAAGLLSLLPVVMGQAKYDLELQTCWLATGPQAMRWVWMSLNSWVVLALLFLIAASAYIGILLTNERRSLLNSLRPHTHHEIPPLQQQQQQQVPAGHPSHMVPRISSSSCSHCYISSISDSALRMGHACPQPQSARSAGPRVPMPQQLPSQHLSNKHMSLPVTSFSRVRQSSFSGSRLEDSFRKPAVSTTSTAAADEAYKPAANSMLRSTGQLQRIEQRIHVLIATGALRVGMRAMVPLLTQLPLVAWSSSYTVQPPSHLLYIAAILLLSIQGLLDMMLYYIFDTQNDQPTVSLPSHLVQSPAMQPSRRCLSRIPSDIYYASMDQMAHSHHQYHPCPSHSLHPRPLLPHMCYLGPPPPPPSSRRRQNARHSVPVADVTCTPTIRTNTATPSIRPNTIHTPSIRHSTTHTPSIRPNAMHMLNGWDESDEHPSAT